MLQKLMKTNDIKKCQKLGITQEVKSIIVNCDCGETKSARLVDLNKMRKWEIMEIIGNYFNKIQREHNIEETDWIDIKRISTFCKAFGIAEFEIPIYYKQAICEEGYEIAYNLYSCEGAENIVLVLE